MGDRVAALLDQMTLEEKVAQLSCIARVPDAAWLKDAPPAEAAADLVRRYPHGVGQVGRPSHHLSPAAAAELTNAIQQALATQTRLGIPALFNEEGVHGHAAVDSTMYPSAIAMAGAWDVALTEEVFAAVAREVRARGSNYVYAPVLDIATDPRWGRLEEAFGEDPYLVTALGLAAVRGLQGDAWLIPADRVLACAKHFAGHGSPESGMNAAPLRAGERELREHHLAPFAAVVHEGQVGALMAAYHEIDGIPCHVNPWLLTEVLRNEWGFRGMVSSDGFGVPQLIDHHRVAEDEEQAARMALAAGIDCEVPEPRCFSTLADQVRSGLVDMELIDRAVSRVLRAKERLGLLADTPQVDAKRAAEAVNSPEHRTLAHRVALRTVTLLTNTDSLLPLDPDAHRAIAVIGPNAADLHLGGYSREGGPGVSVLEGIRERFGAERVEYAEGCRISEGPPGAGEWWVDEVYPSPANEQPPRIAEARAVAQRSDVVILVIGGNEATAREGWSTFHLGDRTSLALPGEQHALLEAVAAADTPTIAVVMGGRPLDLTEVVERCSAVLQIWYQGQECGHAVAAILAGDANPSGKLPVTFPGSVGKVPMTYRDKPSKSRGYLFTANQPLFPFGHGLSYTEFAYSDPVVTPAAIAPGETATASVAVTNSGSRSGVEIVQCYIHDRVATVTRPVQSLCGFTPLHLEAGETKTVSFPIGAEALSLLDRDMKHIVEPGTFEVRIGGSSADYRCAKLEVSS
ncbi:MAG: glycoside hydrolase family 3 N-terminal domain-containing protein [Acidimicrobiia bacterium]|nr:glycoside hydrolase family 3 N-terminal domain-containing protein [Acidimicrobiia bacterium]